MADFLIQRYLHNLTNTVRHESGVWEDVYVIPSVTAAQAKEAAEAALGQLPAAVPGDPDRIRAIRWDTTTQWDAPLGPRVLAPAAPPLAPPNYGGTLAGTA